MVHIIDYMNKIKNCSALLKQKAGENICYEYGRQRVNIHFHAHTCTYICIYELTEKRLRTQQVNDRNIEFKRENANCLKCPFKNNHKKTS